MDKQAKEFLKKYLSVKSPTGYEEEGQKTWIEYISKYVDKVETDAYNSVVATIKGGEGFTLMLEAHSDEISWAVNYIDDNGLIYVKRNGGSDEGVARGKDVEVMTKNGEWLKGVVGSPAIHMRGEDKGKLKVEDLYIDLGFDSKQELLDLGVEMGLPVIYNNNYDEFGSYIKSRGIDNRIGGFFIAEVVRRLHENNIKLPFDLKIANSSQEEIGLMGANRVAQQHRPNAVIVTDVTHHTKTPNVDMRKHGEIICGKGAVVVNGYNINKPFNKVIKSVGDNKNIPYQILGDSGRGTDADMFSLNNIPTTLIKIPNKYMHTTAEMVHIDDIESCINLMYETVVAFDPNMRFKTI